MRAGTMTMLSPHSAIGSKLVWKQSIEAGWLALRKSRFQEFPSRGIAQGRHTGAIIGW
jgi:hypothetical protein